VHFIIHLCNMVKMTNPFIPHHENDKFMPHHFRNFSILDKVFFIIQLCSLTQMTNPSMPQEFRNCPMPYFKHMRILFYFKNAGFLHYILILRFSLIFQLLSKTWNFYVNLSLKFDIILTSFLSC